MAAISTPKPMVERQPPKISQDSGLIVIREAEISGLSPRCGVRTVLMRWRASSNAWASKTPRRRTPSNSAFSRTRSNGGCGCSVFAFIAATLPLQIIALHLGNLSQVQPILTSELLFLVILLATWFRFRVGWREWWAAPEPPGAWPGFDLRSARRRQRRPEKLRVDRGGIALRRGRTPGYLLRLARPALVAGDRVRCGREPSGFALTACAHQDVEQLHRTDWVHIFSHWQTYGVAVCGALSLFVTQNAFHAGPIAASQTALVLVDPLVSIALGIGLYGDSLRTSGAYGPLEAISLLIMFVGAA